MSDREGVIEGLASNNDDQSRAMAELVAGNRRG
jgi:hypothetical protein